jgi:hypothetical protein
LLLSSSFNALWSDRIHGIISIFSYLLKLTFTLRYDQFWRRFCDLLRRMYIVQMLDEIFCRHQLGPFGIWWDLVLEFLYWFFVWMTYLLVMGGNKVSHYHWVGVYMCFLVLQHMFDEIGCTDVGCIWVYNCYFLLVCFTFY